VRDFPGPLRDLDGTPELVALELIPHADECFAASGISAGSQFRFQPML
jgi:hypothetical protein